MLHNSIIYRCLYCNGWVKHLPAEFLDNGATSVPWSSHCSYSGDLIECVMFKSAFWRASMTPSTGPLQRRRWRWGDWRSNLSTKLCLDSSVTEATKWQRQHLIKHEKTLQTAFIWPYWITPESTATVMGMIIWSSRLHKWSQIIPLGVVAWSLD